MTACPPFFFLYQTKRLWIRYEPLKYVGFERRILVCKVIRHTLLSLTNSDASGML